MNLLRAIPRTMLASYFVAAGIKAIRDPESLAPAAEPLVDRVVPLVKEYTPEQVSGYVPENTVTLVRLNGIAQVVGGAALATGRGRRLGALLLAGSLVPSTIAKHPFWTVQDPEERAQDRSHFLKNMSLLGGVLIAAQDTEGKPSLAWRARKGGESIAKETRRASKKLSKSTGRATDNATELAEAAVATGAALLEALTDSSRKLQKQAARQFKEAKAVAAKTTEEVQEAAAKAAKRAQKESKKQSKKRSKREAEREAKREAKQQAKVISKRARERGDNVQLGEN
jgi:uncharacterized membrane protein YphA (DoxX/SURF4 family)